MAWVAVAVGLLAVFGAVDRRAVAEEVAPSPIAWGLFIGISRYQHMDKLAYCAEDARRVAKRFQELRGAWALAPERTVVLTDSQATRVRVLRELRALASRPAPGDVLLFYFSGHGGGEDEPDRPPRDEPDGHDETLVMVDSSGPHDEDISDDELRAILAACRAQRALIVLDACFSGGFVRDLERPGTVVLSASREDRSSSVAFVHRSSGGLTHALLEGISGEADADGDRVIRHAELIAFLERVVPMYCGECGRRNPPRSNRCFYCRAKVGTPAHRPLFGGEWPPDLVWNRLAEPYRPERCVTESERRSCSSRPSQCRCRVKGECGVASCLSLARKILDGCANESDRAVCRTDPELCPCPEYGDCGMGECVAPSGGACVTGSDREICARDPASCPCDRYGNCDMASCRAERSVKVDGGGGCCGSENSESGD